jgi:serine/threonine protein kinase
MDKTCSSFDKDYDTLKKNIPGYTCSELLGSGSFGGTFLFKKGTKKLAVKAVFETKEEDIINEVKILEKIKNSCSNSLCHKKVIKNYIITEYIEGKSMWDYYKDCGNVSRKLTFSFILQLFSGIEELHKIGVLHFDIKPENIMISKNKLKIIDFGGAFYSKDRKQVVQNFYTDGYTPENTKKRMTFKYGVYVDYYCAFRTFRNDEPSTISPLTFVNNVKTVYDLFDTTKLNIKNYRNRVELIKKEITS